jgi:hypothetical protein
MKVHRANDNISTNGDLNANGIDDDEEGEGSSYDPIEKSKININGTTIEYNSEDADSVIINGKKYPKVKADSILKGIKDLNNLKDFKELENLKDMNISIKDGESKIEIKTKK